jgi:hypothetical protein
MLTSAWTIAVQKSQPPKDDVAVMDSVAVVPVGLEFVGERQEFTCIRIGLLRSREIEGSLRSTIKRIKACLVALRAVEASLRFLVS